MKKTLKIILFSVFTILILNNYYRCKKDETNLEISGDTIWIYTLENPDDIHFVSTPLATGPDGTIYFSAGGGGYGGTDWEPQRIFALNKTDGSLKWKTEPLSTWYINSYIVTGDNGEIYVASATKLYFINPSDGAFNQVWEVPQTLPDNNNNDVYTYGDIGTVTLTNEDNILVQTSGDGSYQRAIYNINPGGNLNWYKFEDLGGGATNTTPPSIGLNGIIYKFQYNSSTDKYYLSAINPDNGNLIWTTENCYSPSSLNNISITSNGNIITFFQPDSLAIINGQTGEFIKKIKAEYQSGIVFNDNGDLFLYNQYNGSSVFNISDLNLQASSLSLPHQPVIDDKNQLYGIISDWHPHLSVTDKNGNINWESSFDIDGNSVTVSNNTVYLISGNNILALKCDGNKATSGWPRISHDNRNTFNVNKN